MHLMKFCYCPQCKSLRPKNWYSRRECERCNGDCVILNVKRSFYGYLMYTLDAIALVLIVFYLGYRDWNWEAANFVGDVPQDIYFALILGSVIVSFVLAYLDLKVTTKRAEEMAPGTIRGIPTPKER